MALEFWFDFASTYSYPAAMRIESLARSRGVPVVWRPLLLGPIFQAQGWKDSPFNLYLAKGRYMWRDLERVCAAQGVEFARPSKFPRNGLLAARIACRHSREPWLPEFVRSVYRANFAEDLDIASDELVARRLDALGQPGAELVGEAQSAECKARLREQTERAAALGVFGAPTFMVGEEMFWGNDRLEAALEWHLRHSRGSGNPAGG